MEPTEAEKVAWRTLVDNARMLGHQYAFPAAHSDGPEHMDLRTWLTGQALAGCSVNPMTLSAMEIKLRAEAAVLLADTVLIELSRKQG